MTTIPSQRHLFDIPPDIAYFNCSYYSPQLTESKIRLISGVNEKSSPWKKTPSDFFENAENIRKLSSDIFGGVADGYAIIPAASYGLSTASRAIEPKLKKGDRILLTAGDFPSNVLPWHKIAKETRSEILTVENPEDGNWTKAIINKLDKKIKVAAIPSCHWTNGAYIDLAKIGNICRDYNIMFVIDATQSFGAVPLSIDDVKPDFLVASGYKWLLCPYGFSLLYVSEQWRNSRPLEESWLARENAENFAGLINYTEKYLPGSRRFDVGEKCTPTILPGAIAALEQIKKWKVPNISATLSKINNKIIAHIDKLGFHIPAEANRSPHMFGALLPENFSGDLVTLLQKNNIYISQRGQSIRFSPHIYINDNDITLLLNALTEFAGKQHIKLTDFN